MSSLVIVGGGTAGLAAAATAADMGLDATLVEKSGRLGGMLAWSSGHFSGAGTRRQTARGIGDHPDLHFRDVIEIGHGLNDARLVRRAVDEAAGMVDWLEDLGFPFAKETPTLVTGHELYSLPRTYWGGTDPARGGGPIAETLIRRVGSRIDLRLETRAERLLMANADGGTRVVGVEVSTGGARRQIKADNVILATGGYAANRELVREMQPDHGEALVGCMPHATGDGHRMLRHLGVELTHGDTYVPTMGMIEDPDRPGLGLRLTHARVIVDAQRRAPWEVWVNRRGERFVAEDTDSPYEREAALRDQPNIEMFVIWDDTVVRRAPPPIGPDWTWEELLAESRPWLHVAHDVASLATRLGIPSETLQRELTRYSTDNVDRLGRRHRPSAVSQKPFYAVRVVGGMLLSRGGPAVDSQLRPLDPTGAPIKGVYAVGELLGMGKFSGDSFAGGMSVGPALALGRWVVRRLAHDPHSIPC